VEAPADSKVGGLATLSIVAVVYYFIILFSMRTPIDRYYLPFLLPSYVLIAWALIRLISTIKPRTAATS